MENVAVVSSTLWRGGGVAVFTSLVILLWIYFFSSIGDFDDALFVKKDRRVYLFIALLSLLTIFTTLFYGSQLWNLYPIIIALGTVTFLKPSEITWRKGRNKYLLFIASMATLSGVCFYYIYSWFIK